MRLTNMVWIQIASFPTTLGINRFCPVALAVVVVDNDPMGAQRFADDSTAYDSPSFGVELGAVERGESFAVVFGLLFT